MRADQRISVSEIEQAGTQYFDRIIEVLLTLLLAFGPLALGVVHAWSKQVVVVLAALISLVFGLKLLVFRNTRLVWTWAYLPVALLLLAVVFQLVPLPTAMVGAISPHTASLRQELLGDLPDADQLLSSMPLSLYPHATKHDLRLLVALAAVFVVVVNVYRQPDRIKRLLTVIAGVGGGIALLALAQNFAGNGKIYWSIPAYNGARSGTFINHSHYGQFMNLSLGAGLALLFVLLHETFTDRHVTPSKVSEYLASSASRAVKALLAFLMLRRQPTVGAGAGESQTGPDVSKSL